MKNISILSNDKEFLKRLLTFKSYDKVQRAFQEKGIEISIENIDILKKIICDLEENSNKIVADDLQIIQKAGDDQSNIYFDQKLYNFFYENKDRYPSDFFLNKDYYNGEVISTGIFTIACVLFKLKKEYLKKRGLWELN